MKRHKRSTFTQRNCQRHRAAPRPPLHDFGMFALETADAEEFLDVLLQHPLLRAFFLGPLILEERFGGKLVRRRRFRAIGSGGAGRNIGRDPEKVQFAFLLPVRPLSRQRLRRRRRRASVLGICVGGVGSVGGGVCRGLVRHERQIAVRIQFGEKGRRLLRLCRDRFHHFKYKYIYLSLSNITKQSAWKIVTNKKN